MKKIMIIGYGAMTQEVLKRLPSGVSVGWIVARQQHHADIQRRFAGKVQRISDPQSVELQAGESGPDLVLECASQQAVVQFGEAIVARGWTLALISTGALADSKLQRRIEQACIDHHGHLVVLSGAIVGMDGLACAREGGLQNVTYQSCKSPTSWQGSYAQQLIDLSQVTEPRVFFSGSAREAACLFPANANVAATIALAGIGMDETQVQLMVDPATQRNTHRLHVQGTFGEFQLELSGIPLVDNPKTSMLAALSAVNVCRKLAESDR